MASNAPIMSIRSVDGSWVEVPIVRGPAGLIPSFSINSVQTLPYGTQSYFEVDDSSTENHIKLNVGLMAGPNGSIDNMPVASETVLGGVKIGDGISVTMDGTISTTHITVGSCDTPSTIQEKVVAIVSPTIPLTDWSPDIGQLIVVKFKENNTAINPSLNVNGQGNRSIFYNGEQYTAYHNEVAGSAGKYTFYIWSGEYWIWIGQDHQSVPAHSHNEFDYLDQGVKTTDSPTFANLTVTDTIQANKVYGAVYM